MPCPFQTGYPGKLLLCFCSLGRSEQRLGHASHGKVSRKSLGEELAKEKPCVTRSGEWDRKGATDAKVQGTEELGSEDRSQQDGQTSPNHSEGVRRGRYSACGLPNNAINTSQKQKPQNQQANSTFEISAGLEKAGPVLR